MEASIGEVLQELDIEGEEYHYQQYVMTKSHSDSSQTAYKQPTATVTLDIINEACSKLAADESLPSQVRQVCQNCDKKEVQVRMTFLDSCMDPKGCFSESNKEKAWGKFYAAVASEENMKGLNDLLTVGVASFICLEVFGRLLNTYSQNEILETPAIKITDSEKDIVSYIGGAVLQKLRQRAYRLKDLDEKRNFLKCIEAFTTDKAASGSLTSILDRGGLLKLNAASETLFLELESVFRGMFRGNVSQMCVQAYFEACLHSETVSSSLYTVLYRTNSDDELKEKILKDVVFLYFKIRAHHKCKMYMDCVHRKSHREKREKAFRKRLK